MTSPSAPIPATPAPDALPQDDRPALSDVAGPVPPLSRRGRVIASLLLALSFGLGLWGAAVKSETYDEPMYVLSAYSYLVTGDLSLNREHPPLAKYLMGLPLLLLDLQLPDDYQQQPGIAYDFYAHQPHATVQDMLLLARIPGLLLGIVLGLYVLRWARLAFGETAGLVALALCMLNPNVLAHCRVAANDFAVTVFIFAACYHVWRWLSNGSRASLTLGGLTLGLALASKLTALMLLPLLGMLLLVVAIVRRRPAIVGWGCLALLAAGGVVWMLYLGEARSLEHARQHARFIPRGMSNAVFALAPLEQALESVFGAELPIPLLTYLKGIDHQFSHAEYGHPTYFWGEVTTHGHWAFYLVSTLIKTPEGFLALLLLSLLVWRRTSRGWVHEALLVAFVVSQYVLFSRADVQLGFKYILTTVPFLAVFASRIAADGFSWPRGVARALGVTLVSAFVGLHLLLDEPGEHGWLHLTPLLGASAVAALLVTARPDGQGRVSPRSAALLAVVLASVGSLLRQPHDLMYFNELAGGPDLGHFYSVVGDDWGQDTALLGRWMAEHDVHEIAYDYYGTAEPENWGVMSRPTYATAGFVPSVGLVAVHVAMLARLPGAYSWLDEVEPVAKLGHTIFVYDIDAEDVAAIEARRAADRPRR